MEKLAEAMDWMTQEVTANALSNQRCDFTGWNLTEAVVALALEFKRYNDIQESK